MMNIALIGYGKMGKEIEAIAKERGVKIVNIFTEEDNTGGRALTAESLNDVDVCIEFSMPASVLENINAVASCGKSIVVGTTGWYDKLDDVKRLVQKHNIGFLYASNFSLGVHIFFQIVSHAAQLFDTYPDYDVALSETHHNKKADAPSGTALSIGSVIMENFRRKTELLSHAPQGQIQPQQLHVTSTRLGNVTGTHSVTFDSECDSIELIHTAKNRRGFALGAVVAAEWLQGKKGFYTMQDVVLPVANRTR